MSLFSFKQKTAYDIRIRYWSSDVFTADRSKCAFNAAARAFSHGCIRTERTLHFSGLMAVMFACKSPEEFGEAIASGKTTRFGFDQPFPVYVAYWTMVPDGKGGVKKLADLYGRDAPVVASFAKPGRPTATIIAPERSEEHTSELQYQNGIPIAVFWLKKKKSE